MSGESCEECGEWIDRGLKHECPPEYELERIRKSLAALAVSGWQHVAEEPGEAPDLAFFTRMLRRLETLAEPFRAFLDSPRVNGRTDDDKTLLLAVRRT